MRERTSRSRSRQCTACRTYSENPPVYWKKDGIGSEDETLQKEPEAVSKNNRKRRRRAPFPQTIRYQEGETLFFAETTRARRRTKIKTGGCAAAVPRARGNGGVKQNKAGPGKESDRLRKRKEPRKRLVKNGLLSTSERVEMNFAGDGKHTVIRHFPPVEPAGIRRRKHHQKHRPRVRQIAGQTNEFRHTLSPKNWLPRKDFHLHVRMPPDSPVAWAASYTFRHSALRKSAAVEGGRRLTRPQQVISGITPDPNPISNGVRHKKSTAPRGTHCTRSHGRAAYATARRAAWN